MNAGIVLAAGASSRMGSPKALLPWAGSTLLGYALEQLAVAGVSAPIVVLGLAHEEVRAREKRLAQASVVLNLDEASGRSGSIRLGASAVPEGVRRVLVQSVDQPVAAEVLRALLAAEGEVAVPTFEGRRGHPVCFAGALLPELRAVSETEHGLRAVVRRHDVVDVPVDEPAVLWNLNDPDSYASARA
jgi:molybdenum cofactor cytidylyltransferase